METTENPTTVEKIELIKSIAQVLAYKTSEESNDLRKTACNKLKEIIESITIK